MISARRALFGLSVGTMAFLAVIRPASSHAIILASVPVAGEDTASPPPYLVLRFNGRLEKRLAAVSLLGPGKTAIRLQEREAAHADTLIYRLPALKPGQYQARWKVLSADGHVTEGVVAFTVSAPR